MSQVPTMKAVVTYTFGINFHAPDRIETSIRNVRIGKGNYVPAVIGQATSDGGAAYEVSFPLLSLDLESEAAMDGFQEAFSERIKQMFDDYKAKWRRIHTVQAAPVQEEPVKVEPAKLKPAAKKAVKAPTKKKKG